MSDNTSNSPPQESGHGFGCWAISLVLIIAVFALLTAFLVLAGG